MKHPLQSFILNKQGTILFAAVQNNILAFNLSNGALLDQWTDTVGTDFTIKKKFEKIIEQAKKSGSEDEKETETSKENVEKAEGKELGKPETEILEESVINNSTAASAATSTAATSANTTQENTPEALSSTEQPDAKKQKLNNTKSKPKHKKKNKVPKIPTPGPGAPQIYNDIRNLFLTPSEQYLIATTNSDKAAIVFKLNYDNDNNDQDTKLLELVKRQPFPKRPCSVAVSQDEKNIILGDKFGDVYSIEFDRPIIEDFNESLNSDDPKNLPIPILGHVSMLTSLVVTNDSMGKQKILTADRDEHIRVSNYPKSFVIDRWLFGHREFVSELVIPSFNKELLISAGGDEFFILWAWERSEEPLLQKVNIKDLIQPYLTSEAHAVPERWLKEDDNEKKEFSVSKIAVSESLKKLYVLVEQTKVILVYKFTDNKKFDQVEYEGKIEDDLPITWMQVDNTNDKLYYAVDNRVSNELVKVADLKSHAKAEAIANLGESSPVEVDSKKDIYPLYIVGQLRKRSEH